MRIENLSLVIETGREGGGGFGVLEALHRNNLHFTEGFLEVSRYKAVTKGLQGVTARKGYALRYESGKLPVQFQSGCRKRSLRYAQPTVGYRHGVSCTDFHIQSRAALRQSERYPGAPMLR